MSSYTRTLAEFACHVSPRDAPESVRHEACRILLDCVGCMVAGLTTPAGQIAVETFRGERGPLEATLVGAGQASLAPAALANTILANSLDFEPVGPEGHVCAVAVPVALAVAEAVDASGSELLAGLLAGLEIGGRIGGAVRRPGQSGASRENRLPVRGTAHAIFAVTAAAGRLLGLTDDQMHNAFGIAGYSATLPTLTKVMSSPHAPMTKYDHIGLMAQAGIQAALLAQRGFTGDPEVLEGDVGFWRFAGAQGCDWDFLTRDLGSLWTTPQTWYKRYPVILYVTPGIDVAREVVSRDSIPLDEVERIEVRALRANTVQQGKAIRDGMDAWTSYAYNVAAGLYDPRPRRSWHDPANYRRDELLSLTGKVQLAALEPGEAGEGHYWEGWCPARVRVTAGGQTHEGAIDHLPRIDDAELSAKFRENVGGLLPEGLAGRTEEACWNPAGLAWARDLAGLLAECKPL